MGSIVSQPAWRGGDEQPHGQGGAALAAKGSFTKINVAFPVAAKIRDAIEKKRE